MQQPPRTWKPTKWNVHLTEIQCKVKVLLSLFQPPSSDQSVHDFLCFVGSHPLHVKRKRTLNIRSSQPISTAKNDGEGTTNVICILTHNRLEGCGLHEGRHHESSGIRVKDLSSLRRQRPHVSPT